MFAAYKQKYYPIWSIIQFILEAVYDRLYQTDCWSTIIL